MPTGSALSLRFEAPAGWMQGRSPGAVLDLSSSEPKAADLGLRQIGHSAHRDPGRTHSPDLCRKFFRLLFPGKTASRGAIRPVLRGHNDQQQSLFRRQYSKRLFHSAPRAGKAVPQRKFHFLNSACAGAFGHFGRGFSTHVATTSSRFGSAYHWPSISSSSQIRNERFKPWQMASLYFRRELVSSCSRSVS